MDSGMTDAEVDQDLSAMVGHALSTEEWAKRQPLVVARQEIAQAVDLVASARTRLDGSYQGVIDRLDLIEAHLSDIESNLT